MKDIISHFEEKVKRNRTTGGVFILGIHHQEGQHLDSNQGLPAVEHQPDRAINKLGLIRTKVNDKP